jgi:hypothetical protein
MAADGNLRSRDRGRSGLQETPAAGYWLHCTTHEGVIMTRYQERSLDFAEYVFGVPVFVVVAGVTAAVMAVGLAGILVIERVLR